MLQCVNEENIVALSHFSIVALLRCKYRDFNIEMRLDLTYIAAMMRTVPIDLLRGFIMMLMALDHASGMVARTHFTEIWGVSFKVYPDLGWWLTRFVSHMCAPGFFFLMGMSMLLFAEKRLQTGWSEGRIRSYFFKRGGLILLFMFFLEFPAWGLGAFFGRGASGGGGMAFPGAYEGGFLIPTTVLYGLGMCMILGAFLWKLPKWLLVLISVLSFAFSAWYIGQLSADDVLNPLAVFLAVPGLSVGAMTLYPIIPWLGVVTFGMFWAKLMREFPDKIYGYSLVIGLVFVAAFMVLRFFEVTNFQMNSYHDWISFFTLIKYPPSVVFILITCGINLILLFVFSKLSNQKWLRPVRLFGQTAMFFYIVHLYLYALMGAPFPAGASIGVMYLVWVIGLVMLYFICDWFLKFKRNKADGSFWKMV